PDASANTADGPVAGRASESVSSSERRRICARTEERRQPACGSLTCPQREVKVAEPSLEISCFQRSAHPGKAAADGILSTRSRQVQTLCASDSAALIQRLCAGVPIRRQ